MLFCALHVVHQNTITARTHNTQTFTIFLDSSLCVPRINHVRRRRGGRTKEEEEEGGEDGKDKRQEKERETSSRARKQNAVRSTLLFASRVQGRPPPRRSRGRYSLV